MENKSCAAKYSGIGGQAVMEGVMMRNKEHYAVAVRLENGQIEVLKEEYKGILPWKLPYKIPFLRGVVSFVDSLVLGLKALNYSADKYASDGEEGNKGEDKAGESSAASTLIMVLAFALAIGLFMILPYFISLAFKNLLGTGRLLTLAEGLIRICIFIAYILLISRMEDIRRVFMYHGAEHKCINCIESGHPLTLENVRKASKEHRRCGTSFLLYVMVVSILLFSFIRVESQLYRILLRIALVPVIAGISYELIRLAGRSGNPLVQAMSKPGLWMQRLTTKEPEDEMILAGIASVEAVFDWKEYLKENFEESYKESLMEEDTENEVPGCAEGRAEAS